MLPEQARTRLRTAASGMAWGIIQAVTLNTRERIVVTVLAPTTVTAQLWDFGVPARTCGT